MAPSTWISATRNPTHAAEAAFRKSIELAPNYEAYSNLGYLYFTQKRYNEAVQQFRQAAALNDKDWRVWANLMISYQWLNDQANLGPARAKAQAAIEQLLTITPQDAHAHSILGLYYAQENLRDKALSQVHTALALEPRTETYSETSPKRSRHWAIENKRSNTRAPAWRPITD